MEETTLYPFEYTILTRVIKPQLIKSAAVKAYNYNLGSIAQSWLKMRSFHPMFLLLICINVHTSSFLTAYYKNYFCALSTL